MSSDLIMIRPTDGRTALVPATPHDMDLFLEGVAVGRDVRAKLTMPRSLPEHRFYWGLLHQVTLSHQFYKTSYALHVWLKLKMGLVEKIELHDGATFLHVSSTSFEKRDGITFRTYFNGALQVILEEILPGVKRRDLIRVVEDSIKIKFNSLKFGNTQ